MVNQYEIVYLKTKDIKQTRDKLIKEQNNICPICKKDIVRPCLDHFHVKRIHGSGLCRGVICSNCNVFLGKIENNSVRYKINYNELSNVLNNISEYIKTTTNYMHPSENKELKDKLTKTEYNKIKKYYFIVFPNRKKLPNYPKSGLKTKEFKEILNAIDLFLNN